MLLPPPALQVLEITRASLACFRDMVLITRGDEDLLDALIFTAALDANMAPVNFDLDLQVIYGGVDVSAPDDLRRPVSMNGIAQSLRLPFETVRRRFLKMAREGLCIVTPQGVVVPNEAVTSPAYKAKQRARYDRLRLFYDALKAVGAVPNDLQADKAPSASEPLVRAANRALSEYSLRACTDLLSVVGDVMSALTLLELVLANISGMEGETLIVWAGDPEQHGRPVRLAALAEPWRVSGETIRRHLKVLEGQGFCARVVGGVVAVAPPEQVGTLGRLAQANQANVQRLLARLGTLGVLADWEG